MDRINAQANCLAEEHVAISWLHASFMPGVIMCQHYEHLPRLAESTDNDAHDSRTSVALWIMDSL